MSVNIHANPYGLMDILNSPIPTLTLPGLGKKPDRHIVYLSQKRFKEGVFAFKVISLDNKNSLNNEEKIKNSKRLATIEEYEDGIYLSCHEQYTPRGEFDLYLKLDPRKLLLLGRVSHVRQLKDVGYKVIDGVYAKYLDDKFVELTAAVQKAPVKHPSNCVIC